MGFINIRFNGFNHTLELSGVRIAYLGDTEELWAEFVENSVNISREFTLRLLVVTDPDSRLLEEVKRIVDKRGISSLEGFFRIVEEVRQTLMRKEEEEDENA